MSITRGVVAQSPEPEALDTLLDLTRPQSSSSLYRAHEAGRDGYRQREHKVRPLLPHVSLCRALYDEYEGMSQLLDSNPDRIGIWK